MKFTRPAFIHLSIIFTLALLLGAILRELLAIGTYYYGFHLSDYIVAAVILVISSVGTLKIIPHTNRLEQILVLASIITGALSVSIVYWLYGYWQQINLVILGVIALLSISITLSMKNPLHSEGLTLTLKVAVLGTVIGIITSIVLDQYIAFGFASFAGLLYAAYLVGSTAMLASSTFIIMSVGLVAVNLLFTPQVVLYANQSKYYDQVTFSGKTSFQEVDITLWKGHYWYYYNGLNYFSSIDYALYFEPLVHSGLSLIDKPQKVLIVGGENGLAVAEILKHAPTHIDLIAVDTTLAKMGSTVDLFTSLNKNSLTHSGVSIHHREVFRFLSEARSKYDAIIIDLPDPLDIELNQYYTLEFYQMCASVLNDNGILVTQAGSPYFATNAFKVIDNTLKASGFSTLKMHNQIPSLGEWGWIMASTSQNSNQLHGSLLQAEINIPTKWLNKEALEMMTSFGKVTTVVSDSTINTMNSPIAYQLYNEGTWKF